MRSFSLSLQTIPSRPLLRVTVAYSTSSTVTGWPRPAESSTVLRRMPFRSPPFPALWRSSLRHRRRRICSWLFKVRVSRSHVHLRTLEAVRPAPRPQLPNRDRAVPNHSQRRLRRTRMMISSRRPPRAPGAVRREICASSLISVLLSAVELLSCPPRWSLRSMALMAVLSLLLRSVWSRPSASPVPRATSLTSSPRQTSRVMEGVDVEKSRLSRSRSR